jgi:tRNA-splicing ligase RtcB
MRVPGRIYASERLFEGAIEDQAVNQVANVAHLPGITRVSIAMPDIHWGYGFPIGGVAATDVDEGGVVSPGGVGFDICCGVRLLASNITAEEFQRRRDQVMTELAHRIPRGLGRGAIADRRLVRRVLERGATAAVDAGYGTTADLLRCEERGESSGADPTSISDHAHQRGAGQLGSLGAGNHFLEVQEVLEVVEEGAATAFGLVRGTVAVMIHCGSRGLGHQTCQDHLKLMGAAMQRHRISVPDRQLACVPVRSNEGEVYLTAMATASNFAWANRHILASAAREAFFAVFGPGVEMPLVWDVAHNLAKLETHDGRLLCVHRKGATRAFPAGHPELPDDLRAVGQPVLIPGSMGTASWVLVGTADNPAFFSAAHGAGRVMSRKQAQRLRSGQAVRTELEEAGIAVRPGSVGLLSEEAPYAYKDVDEVVRSCEIANLARPVARLVPLGVVKG